MVYLNSTTPLLNLLKECKKRAKDFDVVVHFVFKQKRRSRAIYS